MKDVKSLESGLFSIWIDQSKFRITPSKKQNPARELTSFTAFSGLNRHSLSSFWLVFLTQLVHAIIKPAFCIVYLNLEKLKMVIYGTIYSTIKTDVMRPPRIHDCTQDSISKIFKFIKTFFIES